MSKRQFRTHRPLYSNALPHGVQKRKLKWKILPIIWLALKRMATIVGFLVLLNIFLGILLFAFGPSQKGAAPSLPSEMVLFLKFEDGLSDMPAPPSFADPFAQNAPTVRDIVDALDAAAADKRVKGIVARMYPGNFSLVHVTEIRAALKRFRDTGKFAHIYSSSFGEGGGGLGRYYLASAFDQIWMQPLGVVDISGVHAEVPYLRGTLDKIGVRPQFFKRKEYKTAYESITDKAMSSENRAMLGQIVADIRTEILDRVPAEREMSVKAFEELVDRGLFTSREAEQAKLITHADYADVLLDNIAEEVTGERDYDALDLVNFAHYVQVVKDKQNGLMSSGKAKVALVHAVGAIMPSGDAGGFADDGIAAADEIAPAILNASKEDAVKAIVLRIDSPGGSPAASESILRAVEKAQERGKIVVVSMGSTAASGGYWIAAYADRIFALPTTLTGSIGVVGGKFALREVFTKMGVNWDTVEWGENSGLWSLNSTFSDSEQERFNAMLDHVYDSFISRVAKGRGMDKAEVDKVAGGRVWTGRRALNAGLVDELGGLEDAMDFVAQALGKEARSDLKVVLYPKPKTSLEQFLALLDGQVRASVMMQKITGAFSPAIESAEPFLQDMQVRRDPFAVYESLRIEQ